MIVTAATLFTAMLGQSPGVPIPREETPRPFVIVEDRVPRIMRWNQRKLARRERTSCRKLKKRKDKRRKK